MEKKKLVIVVLFVIAFVFFVSAFMFHFSLDNFEVIESSIDVYINLLHTFQITLPCLRSEIG